VNGSGDIRLREMRREDLGPIEAIERVSFTLPWTRSMFLTEIENRQGRRRVALDESGRVVGYIICRFYGDLWHIMNLAVREDRRRQGIGGQLMDDFLGQTAGAGISYTLEVRESNTEAAHLYAARGFHPIGRRPGYYHDNREDAIIMTRTG